MTTEDRIADLLLRWEDELGLGRDMPATELCQDCPELVGEVAERIESLKRTAWLLKLGQNPSSPAPPIPTVKPGHVVGGRYRLDRQIGVGGFGEVWEGFDLELQRRVAVKAPRQGRLSSPDQAERFRAEARRLARLKRPGIVAVYDVVREERQCYIITEFIDGISLAERLRQRRPGVEEAVRIVGEIAGHLAFAHGEGFVHADVKPLNILLDAQGRAYLTDFGIAGTVEELNNDNRASIGTLAYASPEQIGGQPVDARTDLYSLGVVFFELLTGQRPFEAGSPAELRNKVLHEAPLPPRSLNPAVPRPLDAICQGCLAKSPANRYQMAQALADDLFRYAARRQGLSRWAWVGVVLLVGSIALGAGFWAIHRPNDDQAKRPGETKVTPPSFDGVFGPDEALFNGQDLTGWVFFGAKARLDDAVKLEEGVLICKSIRQYRLRSEEKFGDFRLRLAYRFPVGGVTRTNGSAILLRMATTDDDAQNYLRIKFGDWATGRIVLPAVHASQTKEPALNPRLSEIEKRSGEWNELEIVCLGKKVRVNLNGEPINELDTAPDNEGWMALAPQGCDVQFRNVRMAKRVR